MKITVFGAGGWGTALAATLAQRHTEVWLYARNVDLVSSLRQTRCNQRYLPEVFLPDSVQILADAAVAIKDAAILILATPSHGVRLAARQIAPLLPHGCKLISVAKGLETDSCLRMSEVLLQEIPALTGRLAVLSGPNHAEEVGRKIPSAAVVASKDRELAEQVQDALMTDYFRIYTNHDVAGVELAGALKTIIALAAGVADGLGFGDNTRAALMTRGLTEMARLGAACGAETATFSGLAGLGDLIATCTSPHSRNRRAGLAIAAGRTISEIQADSGMVVEGVRATDAAWKLAQAKGVAMPITATLYQVLYENLSPHAAVMELMTRGRKHEREEVAFPSSTEMRDY